MWFLSFLRGESRKSSKDRSDLANVVERNSKLLGQVIDGYNNLVLAVKNLDKKIFELSGKIGNISADLFDELGRKSVQLETVKEEKDRLVIELDERIKDVGSVSCENLALKDKCSKYERKIVEHDELIRQTQEELKVLMEKCGAKDGKIDELNKARRDADVAHADELTKLKTAHDNEIADLLKKSDEEVEALNKRAADQIAAVRKSVNEFVPSEVCGLFDYRLGDAIDDRSRWQAIYAYLGFINGNLRQDAFVKRFREFDAALYDAMRDNPDQLAECRVRVQRHVNEEIGKKSGGLLVCWPKIGETCNPDQYTTTSDFGQRISEVISAMIYKKDDGGKVLCQSKGKVATV